MAALYRRGLVGRAGHGFARLQDVHNSPQFCGCLIRRSRVSLLVKNFKLAAVVLVVFCASYRANAQQLQVTLDPAQTKIEWTLTATLHAVHGTFKLRGGNLSFDQNTHNANGEFIVDATSGDSGNSTRDGKMNKDVLESKRYPEITFVPKKVTGRVAAQGTSTVQVQGTFHIHGADHDLTLSVPVQIDGTEVRASASFVVPYEAWGMKNPSTLLLHVDDKVQISVSAVGKLTIVGAVQTGH
jgi:polyisoprenoid-binding protein YceI